MGIIFVPNLKEIKTWESYLNIFVILCKGKEEKCEENQAYGRKYINLVEIGLGILEIQKVEFGNFAIPVNNTLVCCASFFVFLAADTLLCVLI